MAVNRALITLLIVCSASWAAPAGNTAGGATDRYYFRMKLVTVIDQGMNQAPAVDLMIPTTWQFQGEVRYNGGVGGCFADFAAVSLHAQSPDDSVVFEGIPNFTWQFADDPATQQGMIQENQGGLKVGLKPCPVLRPMRAEDFLRQAMPKLRPGTSIVAIEPMPEFNQIVRQRLGLAPDTGGASAPAAIRTDAARARLAYDLNGQPMEEWLSTVILVRTFPAGRGNTYDCHATMLLSMRAPKGKLDGNDKLFKLIASTIRREPKWGAQVDAMISKLYQQKQVEESKRSAIIAAFQQYAAQTIKEVTANQQRGSNASAAGMSQLIRGVQTFRDPATGASFELSNQYDHAWLNGAHEYVMSDDPNFNPNGNLNGSWTTLQPVRAQP